MTNLYLPNSIGSFFDKFSLTTKGVLRASAKSSSVMLISPKIHFNVGILNVNFRSFLTHTQSTIFLQLYSLFWEVKLSSNESYLNGVSNSPFPEIVMVGSYVSMPSWGEIDASDIR